MDRAWRRQTYWGAKLGKERENLWRRPTKWNPARFISSLPSCHLYLNVWNAPLKLIISTSTSWVSSSNINFSSSMFQWKASTQLCKSESFLSPLLQFWFLIHHQVSLIYLLNLSQNYLSLCSLSLATLLPHATNNSSRSLPIALSAPPLAISSPFSYFSKCGIVNNTNLIRFLFHPTLPSIWPFLNTSVTSHCSLSSHRTFAHAVFSAWNALLHPNALSCPYPFTS